MDNMQMEVGGSSKWHWLHTAFEWKARILSILAGISLILAWVATFRGTVFGLIAPHYYWDALILGVLSLCVKVIWTRDCDNKCE